MTTFESTRRALLGLISSLPIFRPAHASDPASATLVPVLAEGQSFRYRKESEQWRNGALSFRSTSHVSLQVLQRLDGGWLVRWTEDDDGLLEADARVLPMLQSMQDLWDGLPVDLVLDEQGRLAGLADPERVQALAAASLDRIVGSMPDEEPDCGVTKEGLRAMLAPILGDGTYLSQSLLKQPAILMGAMGLTYRVGEPLEVTSMAASPVGGGEIPLLSRYSLRGVDAARGRAELGWLMVIDRRRAASAIAPALHDMVDAAGSSAAAASAKPLIDAALAQLDLDDRGDFIVDTSTAWPLQVRHERRATSGPGSRFDRLVLTRLEG